MQASDWLQAKNSIYYKLIHLDKLICSITKLTTMASSSSSDADGHEIHRMISALTDRLTGLGREDGASVLVLKGENKGAVMKTKQWEEMADTTPVSNYQVVTKSAVLGGSSTVDDSSVHIAIGDTFDDDDDYTGGDEHEKMKKHVSGEN